MYKIYTQREQNLIVVKCTFELLLFLLFRLNVWIKCLFTASAYFIIQEYMYYMLLELKKRKIHLFVNKSVLLSGLFGRKLIVLILLTKKKYFTRIASFRK